MSEPLLGEAGPLRPEPALADGKGVQDVPGTARTWAPGGDQSQDRASDQPIEDEKAPKRRRRGSRGGRGRRGAAVALVEPEVGPDGGGDIEAPGETLEVTEIASPVAVPVVAATVVKPRIGDTRPGSPPAPKRRARKDAPPAPLAPADDNLADQPAGAGPVDGDDAGARARRPRRRRSLAGDVGPLAHPPERQVPDRQPPARQAPTAGSAAGPAGPGAALTGSVRSSGKAMASSDEAAGRDLEGKARRGTGSIERRNRPLGRYLMVVHVGPTATQIAVLEGRTLIEHYVSRPADDATQIDGNIYLGRVQNVLPGMEAAFVDIGTPKNAVLYRGDLRYDDDEVDRPAADDAKPTRGRLGGVARDARIEQLLRTGQNVICQVTKNPIGTKGARLTQEVSLPGRFVVLIPESDTYGISKRLGDDERRRLRKILDDIRPAGHGLIVRTAAEGATADELGRDVARLMRQWDHVQALAKSSRAPQLLYREPDLAVRVIREEFNRDYRGVVIDDARLYDQVREYVTSITPDLADRVELVDPAEEALPLFERFRVHEQVHKALDRKVWLPSGGSIIIERTEALTVIDVNTGKNVGTSNLEETVFRNNLEAAEEISRQLRLRDIGGIIVIDFIDMEIMANRAEVIHTFREALARDKTRSQVFDISELGLVEMTRKRISEGLVESYSETCPTCGGRGIVFDESLL
ncbi:MAG: Rne/Rng family ribonuclease [Acidimicrobiales bacterium]